MRALAHILSVFPAGLRLLPIAAIAGCSHQWPTYEQPALDLPALSSPAVSVDRQWWKAYADPALDSLVEAALINNYDLAKAASNVAEARANANAAQALLSPRVDGMAGGGATRRQLTVADTAEFNKTVATAKAGIGLSWELDLWDRLGQVNDAARARLAASEHTQNAVMLSVSSAVADTYFQLRAFDQKLVYTRKAANDLKDVSGLEYRRWKANMGTQLAYSQSLAEQAATEARIPGIEAGIIKTEMALKLLVGRTPRQLMEPVPRAVSTMPEPPAEFSSELLLRRPDVASAEQLLIAAHADLNATRAERYPRLSLSALAGLLATSSNLITGTPLYFDLSAGLTGPIYDAGLLDAKADAAEARREKAVAHYRYTLTLAYRDTYEAMLLRTTSDRQYQASRSEVEARDKAFALTQRSYDAGRSSKYEVLSESIKLLNAQLAMVDARQNQLSARNQIYKALGGGF